jgi:hypothetical protein
MKTSSRSRACRLLRQVALAFVLSTFAAPTARAGLTMEMDLILFDNTYSFSPNLGTNAAAPAVPFGNYLVVSPGWPTNGANALYHYDANGFNQVGGGSYGFANFDASDFNDSFIKNITNGQWSIFVTNSAVTNVYYFTVTANIGSNSIPSVTIIYPPNNALNVTNQPTFLWQGGPTNYSDLVLYQGPNSAYLPVTQTSYFGFTAANGLDNFNVHYDHYSTTDVVSSVPLNGASQPLSSWVSTAHLQDISTSQFTVGSPVANFNADLNTTNLPWATMGDAAWFTETTDTYNGALYAAQSGSVTNSQSSTLSVTVTGPGTLTFFWSSIANDPNQGFDYEFDIDGNHADDISGDNSWAQEFDPNTGLPYAIPAGQHVLSWTVTANGDTDSTQAGYLDDVTYVPAAAPTLTVTDSPPAGLAPLAVQFTSPGVDSFGNTVTNWNWNFGDGGNSTKSPVYLYQFRFVFPQPHRLQHLRVVAHFRHWTRDHHRDQPHAECYRHSPIRSGAADRPIRQPRRGQRRQYRDQLELELWRWRQQHGAKSHTHLRQCWFFLSEPDRLQHLWVVAPGRHRPRCN